MKMNKLGVCIKERVSEFIIEITLLFHSFEYTIANTIHFITVSFVHLKVVAQISCPITL